MTGHTLGPWRVEKTPRADSWMVTDGTAIVAEVFADDGGAAARVMAAGLDLLDACECALSTGALEHGGVADILRAAVAKARSRRTTKPNARLSGAGTASA